MSYVPPHLRTCSPSSTLKIRRSAGYTRRIYIVPETPDGSGGRVEFVRFDGNTYAHLQGVPCYTLKVASSAHDDDSSSGACEELSDPCEDFITRIGITEREAGVKTIMATLRPDLLSLVEEFRSYTQIASGRNRLVPGMWVRFGKLLLQSYKHMRGQFDWERSYTARSLEQQLGRRPSPLDASFDNSLAREEFNLLYDMARKDAVEQRVREKFIIKVEDACRPKAQLQCLCSIVDESSDRQNSKLKIAKVKLEPLRHMIADAARVGRRKDIRLIFLSEQHLPLSEEERADLDSLLDRVSIDKNVSGGLRWDTDSKRSALGRFRAVETSHKMQIRILGGNGLNWHLGKVRRQEEINASSERTTYEVHLKPSIFSQFVKGHQEWDAHVLMKSIEELLYWTWEEVL